MEISTKQLRIGFRLGVYDFDKVQSWVDVKIKEAPEPSTELLDLSFAKKSDKHEMYSLLSALPNSEENDESLIAVLCEIKETDLNNINYCRDIAQRLYAYYVDRDYEVDERLNEIGFFDDGYDLAVQGIGDTVDTWHTRFKGFISDVRNC